MAKKRQSSNKRDHEDKDSGSFEKVVFINRTAAVVKGGRRFSFSALVVVGDRAGHVGYGFGKAKEVADAIRKGTDLARRSMVTVSLRGPTLPHAIVGRFGAARVMLRPASPGTGVIAGGGARAVCEAAGVQDVLAKSLGSSNALNVVKATINGLLNMRLIDEIYRVRGMQHQKTSAQPVAETSSAAQKE